MNPCLVYPSALSNLGLSAFKRMFQVVPVTVRKLTDKRIKGTHWHDYLQIWYTVSGSYRHTVRGIDYAQKPGSAMLIFPYMKHSIDSSGSDLSETTVIEISVKKDVLEKNLVPYLPHAYNTASFDFLDLTPHILFSGKHKEAADRICLDLLAEYSKLSSMHFSKLLSLVTDFLELCANCSEKRYSKREIITVQSRNACIDEALVFLMDNSAERFTLSDVSSAAMMSRSHFTTSFHTMIGQSCHNYINALRMYNAVRMLRGTEKSISEIAKECGFCDSSHFRRQCVELYGVSPLRLRKDLSQWLREYGDVLYKQTIRNMSWAITMDEESLERHEIGLNFR